MRVWGTIGWIVASWPFIFILVNWSAVPKLGDVGFIDWLGTALGTRVSGGPQGAQASAVRSADQAAGLAKPGPALPQNPMRRN